MVEDSNTSFFAVTGLTAAMDYCGLTITLAGQTMTVGKNACGDLISITAGAATTWDAEVDLGPCACNVDCYAVAQAAEALCATIFVGSFGESGTSQEYVESGGIYTGDDDPTFTVVLTGIRWQILENSTVLYESDEMPYGIVSPDNASNWQGVNGSDPIGTVVCNVAGGPTPP